MFDIGPSELLLVCIIGLLVLGPKRLPKVAAEIGKWVGRARRTASQLRRQLEREIELSELEKPEPPPKPSPPTTQQAATSEPSQPAPAASPESGPSKRGNGAADPHSAGAAHADDGHTITGPAVVPPPANAADKPEP